METLFFTVATGSIVFLIVYYWIQNRISSRKKPLFQPVPTDEAKKADKLKREMEMESFDDEERKKQALLVVDGQKPVN